MLRSFYCCNWINRQSIFYIRSIFMISEYVLVVLKFWERNEVFHNVQELFIAFNRTKAFLRRVISQFAVKPGAMVSNWFCPFKRSTIVLSVNNKVSNDVVGTIINFTLVELCIYPSIHTRALSHSNFLHTIVFLACFSSYIEVH